MSVEVEENPMNIAKIAGFLQENLLVLLPDRVTRMKYLVC